jgi:diguanylate cyclase (GGDEF)-like protein
MSKFLIIGSAHLDILAEPTGYKDTVDKPGTMRIAFGGTGSNIAINLSSLGAEVTFVTALNDSAISRFFIQELEDAGVKTMTYYANLPESGFCAMVQDGDMVSAVSAIAVEAYDFKDDSALLKLIGEADWLVLDFNLNVQSLKNLIGMAQQARSENSFGPRIAVALVSQSKALKLSELEQGVDYVFGNANEFGYVRSKYLHWEMKKETVYVITRGLEGASAYHNGIMKYDVKAIPVDTPANVMGAGDAFASGMLYSISRGNPLSFAMQEAAAFATQVIKKAHCHNGFGNSLARQADALLEAANRDKLTGLYNRGKANQVLQKFERDGCGFSILICDIDHFKKINDTYGHEAGDRALINFAQILKKSIDGSDFAFRFGGEEFVVICGGSLEIAGKVAERIREQTELHGAEHQPFDRLTVSIGVSYSDSARSFHLAMKAADSALYRAKNEGRNKVCIESISEFMPVPQSGEDGDRRVYRKKPA